MTTAKTHTKKQGNNESTNYNQKQMMKLDP